VGEFEINTDVNLDQLCETFRNDRRLRITEFLDPASAEALYHYLDKRAEWSSFLTDKGRMFELPPEIRRNCSAGGEQRLIDLAHASARDGGVAYIYDATRCFAGDAVAYVKDESILARFADFVNSPMFLDFVRRVSGVEELDMADAQAMRFRAGNFMTFHGGTSSLEYTKTQRAFYSYQLTPEWKAEWGGLLEFRGTAARSVEAYVPCFNCLDMFAFPQGHWVSAVSPFAGGSTYSVRGGIFAHP
jgi:Rps23 Pro-64 3,4-dihydroxylase Tpa1-like proline 4-hydroxylase